MRKFYVIYRYLLCSDIRYNILGGNQYGEHIITLNENEKANQETLNKKLMADLGGVNKTVLTWSLIEE